MAISTEPSEVPAIKTVTAEQLDTGLLTLGRVVNVITDPHFPDVGINQKSLFDVSAISTADNREAIVLPGPSGQLVENHIVSDSISSMSTQVSVKVKIDGSYELFKGSLAAHYGNNSDRFSESKFAELSATYTRFSLQLNEAEAMPYLTKDIAALINGTGAPPDFHGDPAKPDHVFKYLGGTHFVVGAVFGGQFKSMLRSDKLKVDSETDVEAKITANFDDVFASINGSVEASYSNTVSNMKKSTHFTKSIMGGTTEAKSRAGNSSAEMNAWVGSIDSNVEAIAYQKKGLVPIANLATDDVRANELMEATHNILKTGSASGTTLPLKDGDIVAFSSASGSNEFMLLQQEEKGQKNFQLATGKICSGAQFEVKVQDFHVAGRGNEHLQLVTLKSVADDGYLNIIVAATPEGSQTLGSADNAGSKFFIITQPDSGDDPNTAALLTQGRLPKDQAFNGYFLERRSDNLRAVGLLAATAGPQDKTRQPAQTLWNIKIVGNAAE